MEPDSGTNRWRTGQIGFHQSVRRSEPAPSLARAGLANRAAAFSFPCAARASTCSGCAIRVTSSRASSSPPRPSRRFCLENGVPARRRMQADFDVYEAANLQLFRGDFFALTPALLGEAAAVYDRAALISWAPELRAAYVEHLARAAPPRDAHAADHARISAGADAGTAVLRAGEEVARLYRAASSRSEEIARAGYPGAARRGCASHGRHASCSKCAISSCAY